MFFDQIIQDNFKQDSYAVVAIIGCYQEENSKHAWYVWWVMLDNTAHYKNDIPPSVLLLVSAEKDAVLQGIFHPEKAKEMELLMLTVEKRFVNY